MVSVSGTYSELDSTGNSEVGILTSPLSMAWWLSFHMIAEITGLVMKVEVLDLKWASGDWMFRYLCGSFGSPQLSALNWFIFIPRLGERKFGPQMMHASALCQILPQHSQIILCLVRRSAITWWRVATSLFLEYERLKWWECWPEAVNIVGDPIISR